MTTQDETKSTMPGATRAAARAKNLRALAELQAGFAQHRVEMSATYARELADLARAGSERTIAPIADLLRKPAS
ncbi:phasin family protein [Amaricoccus sp. W119]|uniref:phasin family protein n=1 Tax=Amaricoccus sp. W119 TaxID=3391833 RepID=UPI0039A737E6